VPDREVIAYCRIGERSSHTWFVLTYLLAILTSATTMDRGRVGNLVGVPIEK